MSRSSKIELLYFCVLIESLAGYAYDEKHNGRHTDGKHDDLYPHGTKHAKHDKDATFAYQIVETDRTFTYDAAESWFLQRRQRTTTALIFTPTSMT